MENGISSCRYSFTEWLHTIDFEKKKPIAYERWGIQNSLHVIGTVHTLIGMPKQHTGYKSGSLPWHPHGSRFVGAGITELGIPFSYHADWGSGGRWGIEVITEEHLYRLSPLEKLFRCETGSSLWKEVYCPKVFPDVKEGLAEQIAIMLQPTLEIYSPLSTLQHSARMTSFAEQLFGYPTKLKHQEGE